MTVYRETMRYLRLRASRESDSARDPHATGKTLPSSMLVCLLGSMVALLVPLWFVAEDILSAQEPASDILFPTRKLRSNDLRIMLSSSNSVARAYAIQEIAKRGDLSAETDLIRLLKDSSPVQLSKGLQQTRVAEVAKTALVHIIRLRIWQAPDNIGLLVPYAKAAITGGLRERQAIIEILSQLKEPMARQLFAKMTADPNPLIRQAATDALANMELEKPRFLASVIGRKMDLTLTASLVIMMGCALWAGVTSKSGRTRLRISLLAVIPVVLLGWIISLIVLDFSMGIADERAIDSAIRHRETVALKAMNYQHITHYPGDSYVAQFLVKKGTEDTVQCLAHLLDAAPDDNPGYARILRDRSRWVLSRIIGTRLGTPELKELAESGHPEVRATVAEYLGRLKVRNHAIIDTLTRLTNDKDEEVRKKAIEALAKAARSPVL